MLNATPGIETFQLFAIALFIGALVGVEREKRKVDTRKPSFAGIRTFILLSEAGALSAWLAQETAMPWIFSTALIGLVALIAAAYVLEKRADASSVGLTTELAAMTVFLLGAAVMFGHVAIAVALAVVNTSLLAFKDTCMAWCRNWVRTTSLQASSCCWPVSSCCPCCQIRRWTHGNRSTPTNSGCW